MSWSQKKGLYLVVAILAVSGIFLWHLGYIGIPDPLRHRAEASVHEMRSAPVTALEIPFENKVKRPIEKTLEVAPQKRDTSFTRRMLAAQVLVLDCQDYGDVINRIKQLARAGVNTLIVRAFQNRGDRMYGFARPRCGEGVYFETKHAPVVDPLLPKLVSIGHHHGLKVFAWMETRKMPLKLPDPEGSKAIEYRFEKGDFEPVPMWSIFDPSVEQGLIALYEDVVRCGIDGILIQDDLIMHHCEDFSPEAVALFEQETGKVLNPKTLYQGLFKDSTGRWRVSGYTDTFWEWSRWKNQKLLKLAHKLIQASRAANPQIEFAMNFMYESITAPKNALAWLSQSLVESTKLPIDFYAIMAYHRQLKEELNLTDAGAYETISSMTENALKLIDDPNKILMKVQYRIGIPANRFRLLKWIRSFAGSSARAGSVSPLFLTQTKPAWMLFNTISSKGLQVFFPLNRQHVFFLIIACLACRHHVPFGGFAASDQGHDVIHRKGVRGKRSAAVIAPAPGQLALPPLRRPQGPGLLPLPAESDIVYVNREMIQNLYGPTGIDHALTAIIHGNLFLFFLCRFFPDPRRPPTYHSES
ncbi:MAG: hypothetical protein DRH17_11950 [Deltaproteobacteria bacterium]|nr:MAG: hypothetical protein DRH17_11950 [Deltaproteobacteria bacterium]